MAHRPLGVETIIENRGVSIALLVIAGGSGRTHPVASVGPWIGKRARARRGSAAAFQVRSRIRLLASRVVTATVDSWILTSNGVGDASHSLWTAEYGCPQGSPVT